VSIDIPNRWVVLEFRTDSAGSLWLHYRDDSGAKLGDDRVPGSPSLVLPSPVGPVTLAVEIVDAINALIQSLPPRLGEHVTGPMPLPIFIDPPAGLTNAPWEEWLLHSPHGVDPDRIQPVRLAASEWKESPPFRLPFRLLSVGTSSVVAEILHRIRSANWYSGSREVQEYGFRIDEAASMTRPDRSLLKGDQTADIVLVEESAAGQVLRALRAAPRPRRVRLVMVARPNAAPAPWERRFQGPAGTSILHLPGGPGSVFAFEFLMALIHDHPLHEALKAALRRTLSQPVGPALVSDPTGNQSLRMADAMASLARGTRTLTEIAGPRAATSFARRVGPVLSETAISELEWAEKNWASVLDVGHTVRELERDFGRESTGLVPLANAEASFAIARRVEAEVASRLSSITADEGAAKAIAAEQERRVDVVLERVEYSPLSSSTMRGYEAFLVTSKTALRAGARYRLVVHIGHRSESSLVLGDVPPIDPLLPGGEEHHLDVVVFPLDFQVLGPRVKPMILPRFGSAEPVSFDLRAPRRLHELSDRARLRLGVYHQNHVLQLFLLQAEIEIEEAERDAPVLTVSLDHSSTKRFANLDDLRPRALSIGLNRNGARGSHTLTASKNQEAEEVHFTEKLMASALKGFRDTLQWATFSGDNPRFPAEPSSSTPWPAQDFDAAVRKLARHGRDLYDAMFVRHRRLEKLLVDLRSSSDKIIEILRVDVNYAFPWQVIYDFALPSAIAGSTDPPVCRGFAEGTSGPLGERRCSHGPGTEAFCIFGFWGVRHQVEEKLAFGDDGDEIVQLPRPAAQGAIRLSVDVPDDFTKALASTLRGAIGEKVVEEVGKNDDLIDLMWRPHDHPSVVVVLGHLENETILGEPDGSRIVLVPGLRWLQCKDLVQRATNAGRWQTPNPIVFLLACGSGATEIDTLNDFLITAASLGASAVVGTEVEAFTSLVSRFAQEVIGTMLGGNGSSFGRAVMLFKRQLTAAGNPLGFVFTPIGSADLELVP
jgi:hypothetical protein